MPEKIPYIVMSTRGKAGTEHFAIMRKSYETIRAREDFNAFAMRGRHLAWYAYNGGHSPKVIGNPPTDPTYGIMTDDDRVRFELDKPTYVVWSYDTPIAWWSRHGGWYVTEEKYSTTTSRHTNLVRTAINPVPWWNALDGHESDPAPQGHPAGGEPSTGDPGAESEHASPFEGVALLTYDPTDDTLRRVR